MMKSTPQPTTAGPGTAIGGSTLLRVASEPVSTAIRGEAVILDSRSGRYFGLEGVGARVWELLQAPRSVSEIVTTLLDEYEVDAETCARDVSALVTELHGAHLVVDATSSDGKVESACASSGSGTSS